MLAALNWRKLDDEVPLRVGGILVCQMFGKAPNRELIFEEV